MRKKKIIFLTGTLFEGGAERVLAFLATKFSNDYNIEILCYYNAPRFYDVPPTVRVIDIETDWKCKSTFSKAKIFREYIKSQNQNDTVLIAFMMPFFIFAGLALLGTKMPIIAAERSNPFKETVIRRTLGHLLEKKFSAVVVQSKGAGEFYKFTNNLVVINNPIKEEFLSVRHHEPATPTIISLGRLVPVKNYIMLIDAFAKVSSAFSNTKLIIYGNGVLRDVLLERISQLGLTDKVSLPGATHDVPGVLSEATMYVCTSNYEGMSNSVIEAMASGVPVISTKVFGSIDFIDEGKNGCLVKIGDTDAVATAISKLLKNPELRYQMSVNGQKVKDKLNTSKILNQWEELINSL